MTCFAQRTWIQDALGAIYEECRCPHMRPVVEVEPDELSNAWRNVRGTTRSGPAQELAGGVDLPE